MKSGCEAGRNPATGYESICLNIQGENMISITELNKTYRSAKGNRVRALEAVDLVFPDTGFVSVVGKSGCGKTTLLNMIGSLDSPDSGSIRVGFSDTGYERDIVKCSENELNRYRNLYLGCIFQDYYLVEEWTVAENLKLVLEQQEAFTERQEQERKIGEILSFVDLKGYEKRYIKELSGGQQQRVAIARALIKTPRILIADEPTGNLDYENSESILKLLGKASEKCLVIMVTHDLEAAEKYSDRIIKLRDGRVIYDETTGRPERGETEPETAVAVRPLPAKTVFALAFEGLRIRKLKLILSGITLFLLFSLCLIFVRYRYARLGDAMSRLLAFSGESFFYCMEQTGNDGKIGGQLSSASGNTETISEELPKLFGEENCYPMPEGLTVTGNSGAECEGFLVIGGAADPMYEFTGSEPVGPNEITLTDYQCTRLGIDGIGDTVLVNGETFTVCGITVTGYTDAARGDEEGFEISWHEYMRDRGAIRMTAAVSYMENLENKESIILSGMHPIMEVSENYLSEKSCLTSVSAAEDNISEIIWGRLPEKPYEIAVSLSYAESHSLIDSEDSLIEYTYQFTDLHNEVYEGMYENIVALYDHLPYIEIVGIIDLGNESGDFIVTDDKYTEIRTDYLNNHCYDSYEVLLTRETRADSAIYQELYKNRIFSTDCGAEYFYYQYENNRNYRDLYTIGILMTAVLLALLSILFFYFNVRDNHKKIGILRAVGVTKGDIMKMLLAEAGIVAGTVILFSVIAEKIYFWRKYHNMTKFLFVIFPENMSACMLACVLFACMVLLSVLVPMWIMAESRPVELIRMD